VSVVDRENIPLTVEGPVIVPPVSGRYDPPITLSTYDLITAFVDMVLTSFVKA
jgi:hypothetical protein